jgi:hypothetical protein
LIYLVSRSLSRISAPHRDEAVSAPGRTARKPAPTAGRYDDLGFGDAAHAEDGIRSTAVLEEAVMHLANETGALEADLRHRAEAGSADIEARRRTFGVRGMDALVEIPPPSFRGVAVPT